MERVDLSWDEARSGGLVAGQPRSHGSTEEQLRAVRRRFYDHGGLLRVADRDQQSSGHELLHQRHCTTMSASDRRYYQR